MKRATKYLRPPLHPNDFDPADFPELGEIKPTTKPAKRPAIEDRGDHAAQLASLIGEIARAEAHRVVASTSTIMPAVYLSTREAAEMARVDPRTIRGWIDTGKLASHRAGRMRRVLRADLERLLADGGKAGGDEVSPADWVQREFR